MKLRVDSFYKRNYRKCINLWRLSSMVLIFEWIIEEIKKENIKFLKLNGNNSKIC